MSPTAAAFSLPAGEFVFAALTEEPKSNLYSIHANTCYPEQLRVQVKIQKNRKKGDLLVVRRYFFCLMNIKTWIRGFSVVAMALGLNSCFEIEQTVHLKKDGSGTIVEEMILSAQASGMLQMAALQGGGKVAPDIFGEDAAKKRAENIGKGVTVAKIEKINKDGRTGARTTYAFADINTVAIKASDAVSGLAPKNPAVAEKKVAEVKPITFVYNEGELTIHLPQPKKEDIEAAKEAAAKEAIPAKEALPEMAQMQAVAMEMMKELKISCKIIVEPGIAETDASYHDGDTITLLEMDMSKLMADPAMMKQLQGLDMQDPAAFEKKMKDVKGIKGEQKEKVTVMVK